MKRVIIIVGSPIKHGNTAILVKNIADELCQYQTNIVEIVYLHESNLKMCIGCHQCIMRGEQYCPLQDGRDSILQKMETADGIILVSPIYCMQVSTWMKVFIDHLAYLWHRPRLFNKKVMVACIGGGSGPVAKPVLDYLSLNAKRWGAVIVDKIAAIRFDSLNQKALKKQQLTIKNKVNRFHKSLQQTGESRPNFSDLFWFSLWRNNALSGKDKMTADYKYWQSKGWLNQNVHYYYPVEVNPLSTLLIQGVNKLATVFTARIYK